MSNFQDLKTIVTEMKITTWSARGKLRGELFVRVCINSETGEIISATVDGIQPVKHSAMIGPMRSYTSTARQYVFRG